MEVSNSDINYYSDNLDLLHILFPKKQIIFLKFNTLIISVKKLLYSWQLTSCWERYVQQYILFVGRREALESHQLWFI